MPESEQINYEHELDELLTTVLDYSPQADSELIKKAFKFAKEKHSNQKRESGEEYITHPIEVAKILTELKVDSATIASALLHDVIEKTKTTKEDIEKEFGAEVGELVEGITKMDKILFADRAEYDAENIRKVVFAMAKDVRVILIKLGDRLHNMRTLKYKKPDRQIAISKETLDIYAPIAYKLGIYKIKSELEDLSLKYLKPKIFSDLKQKIARKRIEREKDVVKITKQIQELMDSKGVNCKIFGRAKHFYSIYRKMLKKDVSFKDVTDLLAFRIITTSIDECYRALGTIHSTWTPIPSKFDDYISAPKANGYQSIHTEVLLDGKPIEIQIRTIDMHHISEEGIAAHWRYKETEHDKKFDRKISWLKQILAWKRESKSAKEFVESLKIDLFENEIVVLTPKGDPISIVEGSTPVDFAYRLHTEIGDNCQKAKVNGEIVPLDYKLKPGDIVEITTSKNAKPSRSWLTFAKTSFARTEIRQALGIKGIQKEDEPETYRLSKAIEVEDKRLKDKIRVSHCCKPKFGDEICGFIIKDNRVSVHKTDCKNIEELKGFKKVKVSWPKERRKLTTIRVSAKDRVGMLAQILNTIADEHIKVLSINAESKKEHNKIVIKVDSEDQKRIKDAVSKIKSITSIINVTIER